MSSVHAALEALQDGFIMLDGEERITYWNGAAERMFHCGRESVLGHALRDALPQFGKASLQDLLRRTGEDGQSRQLMLPHANQDARCLAIRIAPVDGEGVAIQFRDATEEFELTERHTRLLESIQDGFIAVDADGTVVYINRVAETLLRLPRKRAVGTALRSLLPRQPSMVSDSLRATMEDGTTYHLERFAPRGDWLRGRLFDIWTYPLPGGGASILFEDVTERVKRERDLARYAAEVEEANRAKSRFFAAISHELRTPLNAIIGYLYLLSSGTYGRLSADGKRAADRAGICADHLSRLVDDVLLLTTTEISQLPVSPRTVAPAEILRQIVEPLRVQAEAKGLRFSLDVDPDTPALTTDPERVRQVLLALLSNAVKFTSTGEIRVAAYGVDGRPQQPPSGVTAPSAAGPYVDIVVSDSGPGIPARDRERIFAPFEQLGDPSRSDSMARGTGLGLTMARQITAALQGALWVEESSLAKTGTAFRLRLPIAFAQPAASTSAARDNGR